MSIKSLAYALKRAIIHTALYKLNKLNLLYNLILSGQTMIEWSKKLRIHILRFYVFIKIQKTWLLPFCSVAYISSNTAVYSVTWAAAAVCSVLASGK